MEQVKGMLLEHLPWSPLDFIRAMPEESGKEAHVEYLTREIDSSNDLRFIGKLPNGADLAIFAEKLPWDTDFFGYGVGKLHGAYLLAQPMHQPHTDYSVALKEFIREAKQLDIKYLFATVDPRDLSLLRGLGELGFILLESRVFYHRSLLDFDNPERYPVRAATESDVERLGQVACDMVNIYDRFHADPFISPVSADRMMRKWVEASILESFADVTLVPDVTEPTAFCTIKYHVNSWPKWQLNLGQPVFGAVGPEFRGWYKKLISEVNYHLKEVGAQHTYLTTQITNRAVLRAWESLGYSFGKGEHILRIVL